MPGLTAGAVTKWTRTPRNRTRRRLAPGRIRHSLGFPGFWALALFVVTLFLEVTGKPALFPAMSAGRRPVNLGVAVAAQAPARQGCQPCPLS
jgi:hypothetical protein